MKKSTRLPGKPSELILLALSDLKKVERSKDYIVDMSDWHQPNGKCSVCLAGAVMAFSLGVSKKREISLSYNDFSTVNVEKLRALNSFRIGEIGGGLNCLGIDDYTGDRFQYVASYIRDSVEFKSDMKKMAKYLKSKGL